jgi:hypothetical protein
VPGQAVFGPALPSLRGPKEEGKAPDQANSLRRGEAGCLLASVGLGRDLSRSMREVEFAEKSEERYRNRYITFAINIMNPAEKAIDPAKILSTVLTRLIHFVFYETSPGLE